MSKFACISRNMPKCADYHVNGFCFTFPHVAICITIPFLLKHVVTYLNIYMRLEIIV